MKGLLTCDDLDSWLTAKYDFICQLIVMLTVSVYLPFKITLSLLVLLLVVGAHSPRCVTVNMVVYYYFHFVILDRLVDSLRESPD